MAAMGGALKRREKTSARLGDVLSMMYLISATLKRYEDQGRQRDDLPLVHWSVRDALWQRKEALRKHVIKVDDFPQDFGRAEIMQKLAQEKPVAAKAA